MELKQGYKKTEVGIIPENWEVKNLNEIATLINGRAFKQEELLKTGKYRVLRVGNFFTNGNWYFSNLELQPQFYVQKDDLMYAWSASFGPKFWLEEKCIYHYHIWKVIPQNNADKNFLFYLFDFDKAQLLNQTQGGTMFHLTKSGMDIRPFPLPTLAEQTAIATALSDTDALIASLEKLIVKKQAIKQGVMQELLKPKEGWVTKKLGEIAEIYQPVTISQDVFKSEGYLVYGANGVVGMYDKFNHETWQTTITCRGSTCGTVNRTIAKSWITGNAMVMNVDSNEEIDKMFFYFILYKQNFSKCITGSGQPQIVREPLREFEINIPKNKSEQISIANILVDLDQDLVAVEKKLIKLKLQKQGMMQTLLTGKIRLV